MANKLKGITVQLGGDTTGLDKALKKTNKGIKDTQSELKEVERLLKLDPKNTELLAQKQKLLGRAIEETKGKLDTLKKAEAQAQEQFKQGKISEEQYNALKREIIATEQQLKNLEAAAGTSKSAMEKVGAAADKIAAATDKAAQKTKKLSAAAAGAAAAMVGMAIKAGVAADDINTMAKQSGFGTDEIQKWQYAADRIDVDVDTIVKSAQRMKKAMASTSKITQEAWKRIGISPVGPTGELRDANEVFYLTLEALSKIENETERDTLAMQLFGKSADEMAGLVDDGGLALKELGLEAEQAGLILSQDALDGANKFNDGIDELKAKAAQAFFSAGASLAENLLPVMDDLVEILSEVLTWVANLDGETLEMILGILAATAALSPLLSVVSKLSSSISFLAAHPLVALAAALVAFVIVCGTQGDKLKDKLQDIDDYLQDFFAKDWTEIFGPVLGEPVNSFFDHLKKLWDGYKKHLDGMLDFWRGVFTGDWERVWTGVKEIFGGIWQEMIGLATGPIDTIIGAVNGMVGAVESGVNSVIDLINRIPSVDIPEVNLPRIPDLGGGGSDNGSTSGKFGSVINNVGNRPHKTPGLGSGGAHRTTGSGNSFSMVQNIYSPRPLNNYEIYRQTQNQVRNIERAMG